VAMIRPDGFGILKLGGNILLWFFIMMLMNQVLLHSLKFGGKISPFLQALASRVQPGDRSQYFKK
jgi:hypothetical protein